jgi:hypothetical protein
MERDSPPSNDPETDLDIEAWYSSLLNENPYQGISIEDMTMNTIGHFTDPIPPGVIENTQEPVDTNIPFEQLDIPNIPEITGMIDSRTLLESTFVQDFVYDFFRTGETVEQRRSKFLALMEYIISLPISSGIFSYQKRDGTTGSLIHQMSQNRISLIMDSEPEKAMGYADMMKRWDAMSAIQEGLDVRSNHSAQAEALIIKIANLLLFAWHKLNFTYFDDKRACYMYDFNKKIKSGPQIIHNPMSVSYSTITHMSNSVRILKSQTIEKIVHMFRSLKRDEALALFVEITNWICYFDGKKLFIYEDNGLTLYIKRNKSGLRRSFLIDGEPKKILQVRQIIPRFTEMLKIDVELVIKDYLIKLLEAALSLYDEKEDIRIGVPPLIKVIINEYLGLVETLRFQADRASAIIREQSTIVESPKRVVITNQPAVSSPPVLKRKKELARACGKETQGDYGRDSRSRSRGIHRTKY